MNSYTVEVEMVLVSVFQKYLFFMAAPEKKCTPIDVIQLLNMISRSFGAISEKKKPNTIVEIMENDE